MSESIDKSIGYQISSSEIISTAKQAGLDISKYNIEEIQVGLAIELEHGTENPVTNITNNDLLTTLKIVLAHLNENPNYYLELLASGIDEQQGLDIDDLIDILPADEIDSLLNNLDSQDYNEDANLIQRGDHSTTDPELSRKAKERYRNNREKYRKAFDKFQRSAKGQLFYKKLGRYNQRPSILNKNEMANIDKAIDTVVNLSEQYGTGKVVTSIINGIQKEEEEAEYPWDQCIADRLKDGYSKESAEKICGAIKAKSQG